MAIENSFEKQLAEWFCIKRCGRGTFHENAQHTFQFDGTTATTTQIKRAYSQIFLQNLKSNS